MLPAAVGRLRLPHLFVSATWFFRMVLLRISCVVGSILMGSVSQELSD